jgi:hypothetical protein
VRQQHNSGNTASGIVVAVDSANPDANRCKIMSYDDGTRDSDLDGTYCKWESVDQDPNNVGSAK